jgi:chromosome segregation ATPase
MRVKMKSIKLVILEKVFNSIIKNHQDSIDKKSSRTSFQLQNKDSLIDTSEKMLLEIESIKKELNKQSTKGLSLKERNFILESKVNKVFDSFVKEDSSLKKIVKDNLELEKIENSLKEKSKNLKCDILNAKKEQEECLQSRNSIEIKIENYKKEIDSLSELLGKSKKDITYSKNNIDKLEETLESKKLSLSLRENELEIETRHLKEVQFEVERAQGELDEVESNGIELKLLTENLKDLQNENKSSIKEIQVEILKTEVEIEDSRCLFEIENGKNLELVEKIKESTREINSKKDELTTLSIELCELQSCNKLKIEENQDLSLEFDQVENDLINASRQRKVIERDLEKYQVSNESLEEKITSQNEKLILENEGREYLLEKKSELISSIDENNILIEKNNEELQCLRLERNKLRTLVDTKTIEIGTLKEKSERIARTLSSLEKKNSGLTDNLDELNNNESELTAKLKQLENDQAEQLSLNSKRKKEITILEIDISNINVQLESIHSQLSKVSSENEEANDQVELLNSKLSSIQREIIEKSDTIDSLEDEIINNKSLVAQKEDDILILNKDILELDSKISDQNTKRSISLESIERLNREIDLRSREYSKLKQSYSRKITELKGVLANESSLNTNLEKVNGVILEANSAIEKVEIRFNNVEASNDEKSKLFASKKKELTKKKKLFKNLKEQYLVNNKRRIELEEKNKEVVKELAEIDILLRVEKARGTSIVDNDTLEDKNYKLKRELDKKRAELVELVESQERRPASRRISRSC